MRTTESALPEEYSFRRDLRGRHNKNKTMRRQREVLSCIRKLLAAAMAKKTSFFTGRGGAKKKGTRVTERVQWAVLSFERKQAEDSNKQGLAA